METIITIAAILISLAIGIVLGMIIRKKVAESKIEGAEQEAKRVVELAKIEAENLKKEEIFKAKEEIMASRKELDQEIKERRGEVQRQEARLIQKEENLERRSENFEKKERELDKELENIEAQKQELEKLGYKNLFVSGCPSLFMCGFSDNVLNKKIINRDCFNPMFNGQTVQEIDDSLYDRYPNSHFFDQGYYFDLLYEGQGK